MRAVLVDYGVGNMFSMYNALLRSGFEVSVAKNPSEIRLANTLILPGVGNFEVASRNLERFRWTLSKRVEDGAYILGSCLGMQLLFNQSEEGSGEGLAYIKGVVKQFEGSLKIPHMGWNTITISKQSELLDGVDGEYFYFVHSYYPEPVDPNVILATTCYGVEFASVVGKGNVFGCQFHPEKSGKAGAKLLGNFRALLRK
jgi:glutamine amidotransferase